ncbi:GntR family transcriptional regulator [Intrasporangium calvum]|uniref:Transcriptional regulator, GntR family n=1 Tax=Intrasporangium calvum (strain ATCC 23552 / DSM 43043 / JCM 3097 / NBRC 12989 / NCIMB 10167 / NRRL B-3866 / 7 KIP) TaxID=710696 RepID=E6SD39_INTC7|nr:GntR family transcriptional regulator [Intrasporangium calvum]ADU49657.1 transcriptional regulator, GntR family [Intrasporangium calvum DSM 43043]
MVETRDEGEKVDEAEDRVTLALPSFDNQANLRQQVGDALRALLITGQMRPGNLYSAPKLAAQFGVSATPVREAMLDLVSEGLVEVVRNKGFRVTELRDSDLDAMSELRSFIEVPVMGLVAAKCEGSVATEVEGLRPLARRITDAAAARDLVTYAEADIEFHGRFLALHGNEHVVQVVRELRHRSRLYGLEALAEAGVLAQLSLEHEQMVDAALRRDEEGMRRLVAQHLGHIRSTWAGRPQA